MYGISLLINNMGGVLTSIHVCVDSSQTVPDPSIHICVDSSELSLAISRLFSESC